MSPLNQKRVELVPTNPGSDWRDLPITVVELEDGTITRRLEYQHRDREKPVQEGFAGQQEKYQKLKNIFYTFLNE